MSTDTKLTDGNITALDTFHREVDRVLQALMRRGYHGRFEIGCQIHNGDIQEIEHNVIRKIRT